MDAIIHAKINYTALYTRLMTSLFDGSSVAFVGLIQLKVHEGTGRTLRNLA